jgi:SNF2 family DNA or RNA helicase
LIRQWEREIKTKIKRTHSLSCFVYHSGKKANFDFLRTHDIVLTTYGTLGAEYKRLIDLQAKVAANPGMDQSIHQSRLPFLGQRSKWYRVILDEAQCIKNKGTKSALGAAHLQAQYRFCLTGTPMMNGVHELYSLIHFLRIKPYNDYRRFNEDFGCLTKGNSRERQLKRAMQKLQAVLKAILLRRTKTSKIDGNPILTLPEKTEEVVHALFNEDEQAYYTSLETKTQVQFNRYLKAGTVGKNYSNILVLLLRLRQAACHPHLIMDFEEAPTEATAEQMINLAQNLHPDVVGRIIAATVPFECPVCYDPIANPSIVVPCGHDTCAQCLVKISANFEQGIANGEEAPLAKCPTCRGPVDLKKIIDYETFKLVHLQDANSRVEELDDNDSDDDSIDESDTESEDEGDRSDGDMRDFIVPDNYVSGEDEEEEEHNTDDLDYKPVAKVKDEKGKGPATTENGLLKKESAGLKNEKTEDDDDDLPDLFSVPKAEHYKENDWDVKPKLKEEKLKTFGKSKSKSKKSRKGKKSKKSKKGKNGKNGKNNGKKDKEEMKYTSLAMLKKEASKSAEGRRRYMRYLRKNWISSAKVDKCMEILRNADPDVKTIIFSQFTTLLDLAEIPIQQEKWGYERYDGSMSADARNNAILSFTDDARCKILLVSLKAGNAGLNLVAASQVIILDPFWNPFIEMQAVDRAHRIGQQNEVKVHRILVKSTVEDRIIELQNRKRKLVEAALDEKASRGLGRLGQEELIYLFGSDGARRETAARPVCQPGAQVGAPVDFDDSDASIENIMINLF